jgi:inositol-1,4,5-trisphosphate 5-phosphatase
VLTFFCLAKHAASLRGLETQYTRLGFGGYWGSKGVVSVRFEIYGVSFCILNSHLAAHPEFNQARIDSYNKIMGEHLYTGKSETEMILYHDYVIWAGDLNFRLEEGSFSHSEVLELSGRGELGPLLARDQLSLARQAGEAFSELQETLPTFPPTYKYRVGSSEYDTKRLPAWTDRILYKANVANYESFKLSLRQHAYSAHQHFTESDHKPVSSQFSAAVFSAATAATLLLPKFGPIVEFVDSGPQYCNEDLTVVYTVRREDRRHLSTWDWVGVFR